MNTNRDRALSLLNDLAERMDDDAVSTLDAVQGLHDAGLLADDLPTPDRDGRWWPTAASIGSVTISPAGEIVLHSGRFREMTLHLTPAKATDLANILNAAAAHVYQKEKP